MQELIENKNFTNSIEREKMKKMLILTIAALALLAVLTKNVSIANADTIAGKTVWLSDEDPNVPDVNDGGSE